MRSIITLILLILIFMIQSFVLVQAQGSEDCNPAEVIAKAAALKSSGDRKQEMEALLDLAIEIQVANIACNGYVFAAQGNKVLGPFDIEAGNYRVIAITSDYSFDAEIVDAGEEKCVDGFMADQLFSLLVAENVMGPKVESKHEALLKTAKCRMIIKVEVLNRVGSKPWTLAIEPLK